MCNVFKIVVCPFVVFRLAIGLRFTAFYYPFSIFKFVVLECRSNVKCCAASYSETATACHLDISGTCNAVKTSTAGWITMMRDDFGEYESSKSLVVE
jgi:hypothetical protein